MTDTQDWPLKARTLAEALPYMRRYNGTTFVIKYGGHAMGDDAALARFAGDIVLLKQVGINPIVVHGGGPQIGEMLERLGIKTSFVNGLRVTDQETVEVAEMVLAGTINKKIAGAITKAGGKAIGLSGKDADLIHARKMETAEGEEDLGFVGEPTEIREDILDFFSYSDMIPVIAPIGTGPKGETYNINADTAAGALAAVVKATRFLLLTDVPGVLDEKKEIIAHMSDGEARSLIKNGTISGGMIPKVETCLQAVEGGVEGAVIMDGRVDHAILLEIFTEGGVGTLIGKI